MSGSPTTGRRDEATTIPPLAELRDIQNFQRDDAAARSRSAQRSLVLSSTDCHVGPTFSERIDPITGHLKML